MELPGFRDMEEHPSPKVRWMRKNKVAAYPTDEDSREFKMFGAHIAECGEYKEFGPTKDDAINRLAQILWIKEDIKPWNMK